MEVASTLLANNDDHRITIVTRDNVPFELQFGRKIGEVFARLASQITFENKHGIVQFEPNPSDPKRVGGVRLSNGQLLPSDMVVVAVGITPETSYVQDRQLLLSDQSILVNEYMQVQGIPSNDVYAAGDIATFPADFASQPIRIEHWNVAIDQGI